MTICLIWSLFFVPQLRHGFKLRSEEKRHKGDNEYIESLAERAQEEPLSYQRREDHAGHHHQDDADAGLHVVCQCEKKT